MYKLRGKSTSKQHLLLIVMLHEVIPCILNGMYLNLLLKSTHSQLSPNRLSRIEHWYTRIVKLRSLRYCHINTPVFMVNSNGCIASLRDMFWSSPILYNSCLYWNSQKCRILPADHWVVVVKSCLLGQRWKTLRTLVKVEDSSADKIRGVSRFHRAGRFRYCLGKIVI